MAKIRRTSQAAGVAVPASAFLDDMRALIATPNPDAGLLVACDRFQLLWEEVTTLYRQRARGFLTRVRETAAERDALEAEIAATPARTLVGRRAKAEIGLSKLQGMGIAKIAHSALRDFLNASWPRAPARPSRATCPAPSRPCCSWRQWKPARARRRSWMASC